MAKARSAAERRGNARKHVPAALTEDAGSWSLWSSWSFQRRALWYFTHGYFSTALLFLRFAWQERDREWWWPL